MVAVQRLGLVPRVAYTYDEMIGPDTRTVFVIAPVNPPPRETMAWLREFVRSGGNLIVMDDSRIGEKGSARALLDEFDVSIVYHGPAQGHEGHSRPHVHIGGMEAVPVSAADTFVARKTTGRGQVFYMWDAANFSRNGLGHCFARPWGAAKGRYETVFAVVRDVLGIAPGDRRFYGIL